MRQDSGGQRNTVQILGLSAQTHDRAGGHTHGGIRNADGGVGQAAGEHAEVVAVQLRYRQHARRGQAVDNGFLLDDVSAPGLLGSDAGRGSHDEDASTQLVAQIGGGDVHRRQLGLGGRGFDDHDRFERIGAGRAFQRLLPGDVVCDRSGHAGPAITAVAARCQDLGFQVAVRNAQLDVQIALGVQRDQLADVLGGGTDEQEIAFDLGHGTLAEVEIVYADFAECHKAVPR